MNLHPRKRNSNERGSILIWVALFMIVMLAFVALGVDGAKLMATRTQLQNAADAGALAGASAVNPTTGLIDQAEATPLAQATAASNKAFIGETSPVLNAVVTFPSPTQCKVDVTRSGSTAIVTHIAQVVGVNTLNSDATATAGLERPDCVRGLRPLGVAGVNADSLVRGNEYKLTYNNPNPANYQHLDLSQICPPLPAGEAACGGSSGCNLLKDMIKFGCGSCIPMDRYIRVEPGVCQGPVDQGITYLFGQDEVKEPYPASQSNAYLQYHADGGNDSRVVVVPIVDFYRDCSPNNPCVFDGKSTGCNGSNAWGKVKGFAAFFLKRPLVNGKDDFYGEFIDFVVPGEGSGGNGTVFTLKLIK